MTSLMTATGSCSFCASPSEYESCWVLWLNGKICSSWPTEPPTNLSASCLLPARSPFFAFAFAFVLASMRGGTACLPAAKMSTDFFRLPNLGVGHLTTLAFLGDPSGMLSKSMRSTRSRMSAAFTCSSSKQSTLSAGDVFTSRSQGLRSLSMRMSKPKSSKQVLLLLVGTMLGKVISVRTISALIRVRSLRTGRPLARMYSKRASSVHLLLAPIMSFTSL
mmetsp:Transcript_11158/g.28225  ORF Transcript_11158/g.28225 Transcript_11158/m.28225 type:complete len:220 (-) Transcript_11158:1139-1798(-)